METVDETVMSHCILTIPGKQKSFPMVTRWVAVPGMTRQSLVFKWGGGGAKQKTEVSHCLTVHEATEGPNELVPSCLQEGKKKKKNRNESSKRHWRDTDFKGGLWLALGYQPCIWSHLFSSSLLARQMDAIMAVLPLSWADVFQVLVFLKCRQSVFRWLAVHSRMIPGGILESMKCANCLCIFPRRCWIADSIIDSTWLLSSPPCLLEVPTSVNTSLFAHL